MAKKQKVTPSTEKRRAYIAVMGEGGVYHLGIAVEGEKGYNRFPDDHDLGGDYASKEQCERVASGFNKDLGLTPLEAAKIVASTMNFKR